MKISKNAFTMIELIFVIVILGILAVIAFPRVSATRNDAIAAVELMNVAQGLHNLASEYTSKGSFANYTVSDANKTVKCFIFTLNNATDGNISISTINAATSRCSQTVLDAVKIKAGHNGIINTDGSMKTYVFKGGGVVE